MDSVYADSESLPLLVWACSLIAALLVGYAVHHRRSAWMMPCLAVIGTVYAWYLGDILYNGMGFLSRFFTPSVIRLSLWQVLLFLIAYGLLCKEVSGWFVRDNEDNMSAFDQSDVFTGEEAQREIGTALKFALTGWIVVFFIGQARSGFPLKASLFPYLSGYYVNLWQRDRLGGATGFLVSTGYILHLSFSAMFGPLLILGRQLRQRYTAGAMMLLAWPFWLFGFGRNAVLVIGIPATAAYVLFARHRMVVKVGVVLMIFLATNFWLKFVIATRTEGVAEAMSAIIEGGEKIDYIKKHKHLGFDMFKELCHMNNLIQKERHHINWGHGYFAEAVNFVPRAIWPGKPTIGIEFSKARGAIAHGTGSGLVSVAISPGMIGQGVENFGGIVGPIAAAFLMSLWTGILARFWTQRRSVLRTLLFLMGLGLTFNTGRSITLLVFFPVVFSYLLIRLYEAFTRQTSEGNRLRQAT